MALDAVAQLDDKISGPASAMTSAIGQLQTKLGSLVSSAGAAVGGIAGISAGMSSAAGSITNAGAEARGALSAMTGGASEAAGPLSALQGIVSGVGAAAQSALSPTGGIGQALGALGPEGEAAAAALQVVTAALTATVGVMLAMGQAAISITQSRDAMLATFGALSGGVAGGKATLAIVDKLASSLPFTTDQVGKWATSLQSAGLQGKGLETAIKAVAAATAIMGESGGNAAQNLIKKLAEGGKGADTFVKQIEQGGARSNKILADMGLQTKDVAAAAGMTDAQFKKASLSAAQMQKAIEKALQKKGAGPLDELSLTFPSIIAKAKEGFLSLFDGLGSSVKPFMAAVKSLFGEFNKGSSTTKTLKPVITEVFSTLFAWATRAVNFIHEAFQQIVIAGLKVRIAMDPIIVKLKQLASNADFLRGVKILLMLLVAPFVLIAAAALIVIVIIGAVIAVFVGLIYAAIRVGGVVVGAIVGAFNKMKAVVKGFSFPSLADAAGNMITSFVTGITGKIGSVISAMAGMGKAAGSALKSALGIASPSKVAMSAATNVTSTFSDGIDDGKSDTKAAFAGLVDVPKPGKGGGGGGGGGGDKSALSAALNRIADALEASPGFREMLLAVLEEEDGSGSDMQATT